MSSAKDRKGVSSPSSSADADVSGPDPGKIAATDAIQLKKAATEDPFALIAVQAKGSIQKSPSTVQSIASQGVSGSGGSLPHLESIQSSFGGHDVSDVKAHVGGSAGEAASAIGAEAYATGNDVAFKGSPDLHTAAHEAAHVVQQKAGVSLKGGVGAAGDRYEQHADAVADKVVAGESAEGLLSEMTGGGSDSGIQKKAVQMEGENEGGAEGASNAGTEGANSEDEGGSNTGNVLEQIQELLSYGVTDWAITDSEATQALNLLGGLSAGGLESTLNQLNQEFKTRLLDNLPESARATGTFARVLCAMGPAAIQPYINQLLSYGIFDWAITDREVETIYQIFSRLPAEQAVQLYNRLSEQFKQRLLENMASGSGLSATQKQVLWILAQGAISLEDMKKLFKIRFNHELTDTPEDPATEETEAAAWTVETIRQVWLQLNSLPDADVSDTQVWGAFQAINSSGGFYIDSSHIELGVNASPEKMAHTVRHEVGHGVHQNLASHINGWLQNSIDFWETDLSTWISELGGYPSNYQHPDEGEKPFDETAQARVVSMIDSWMNNGKWDPSRAAVDTDQSEEDQAIWAAMTPEVKNACTQSVSYWYSNYSNFQQVGGRSFFLNHWYHKPYRFGSTALQAIDATGDDYTAMSEQEFFANCYAEFFEDPEGINDNSKWGGSLPESVKSFFQSVIVSRHPYSEWQAQQGQEAANNENASGTGTGGEGGGGGGGG